MSYKVLQVIDKLDIGGAEKITVMLANLMVDKGYDSGLLTIVDAGRLIIDIKDDVKHINLNRGSKWNIITALNFMKLTCNYDLIHIHLRHNLKWVLFWSIILRVKLNIVFHDHSNTVLRWNFLYYIHQCNISHILVNQNLFIKQSSNSSFFSRVYFLENIINPLISSEAYISNKEELTFIIVSNLRRIKNIEFAIKLVSSIANANGKKLTMDIYYANFEERYLADLQNLSKNLNIQLNVNFIKGELEPQLYFYKYDLALHTSTCESGPLIILEYMAHGLPFISFDTGQSIALVRENYPEFIASSFNMEEWINSLNLILDRGRLYYEMKLKELFQNHCSLDNYFLKCKEIYKENLG